jgi:four helix bundle protein
MSADIVKFEDLKIWKEGMRLARDIYLNLKSCRDFGLKDQMQRASVSIPSNIAEGFKRNSNKEFIRFLYIALASCAELRTQVYLSKEVGILNAEINKDLVERTRMLSAMIRKFIKTRVENFS